MKTAKTAILDLTLLFYYCHVYQEKHPVNHFDLFILRMYIFHKNLLKFCLIFYAREISGLRLFT